ncbi:MAG: sulfatase-like hydrolase/transferase [Myxococcota bacterium]
MHRRRRPHALPLRPPRRRRHLDDHQQCASWTFHSTTCTLLGRMVERSAGPPSSAATAPTPSPDGQPTLAARLTDQGFHTGICSAMGWMSAEWNNRQGYRESIGAASLDALPLAENALGAFAQQLQPGERWFLHLHFTEPRAPYAPPTPTSATSPGCPPSFDLSDHDQHYEADDAWPDLGPADQANLEQHLRLRYTAETRWLDDQLRTLFAELDAGGWLDDTLVVVWTDHGEQFWEHGEQTHAWTLNAQENDAILAFWRRGGAPLHWTGPTHAVDLVPTVLSMLGLPVDPDLPGFVVGEAPADRIRVSTSMARQGPQVAATGNGYKLVYDFDGGLFLWDRPGDRADAEPLPMAQWDTDAVRPLWQAIGPMADLLQAAGPEFPRVPPALPPGL